MLKLILFDVQDERATGSIEFQKPDDVESLRAALAAAEARAEASKKAEKQALDELAAMEAKLQDTAAKSTKEFEAAKEASRKEKQEALKLAVQVENISKIAIQNATERIAEEARVKVLAAETAAAEAILELEERLRVAADEAASAVATEASVAIDEARSAATSARAQAGKYEAILNEQVKALNELAEAEVKVLVLEEALLTADRQLRIAKGETDRYRIELKLHKG